VEQRLRPLRRLRGQRTLNITGGAAVSNSYYCQIGIGSGSTGVVTVNGAGSTWNNSGYALYVGLDGSGTLSITGGGSVSSNNQMSYIGFDTLLPAWSRSTAPARTGPTAETFTSDFMAAGR